MEKPKQISLKCHPALYRNLPEDERERIIKRTNDGRQVAKANGVKFGRKPKLTEHQQNLARQRLLEGDSARSIAKDFGVSHTTITRLN